MGEEPKVELHSRICSCGGGSWIILGKASHAPCSNDPGGSHGGVVIPLSEWRAVGKPNSVEAYADRARPVDPRERREFKRYAGSLQVTLSRMPTWRDKAVQREETTTEVIAQGGALVRTRMAVEEGEVLIFEVEPHYKTKAQVLYITRAATPEGDVYLRIGIRFIDELMPESLIPFDAEPLEHP